MTGQSWIQVQQPNKKFPVNAYPVKKVSLNLITKYRLDNPPVP